MKYCREVSLKKIKEAQEVKKVLIDVHVKGKVLTPKTKERLEKDGIVFKNSRRKMSVNNYNESYSHSPNKS